MHIVKKQLIKNDGHQKKFFLKNKLLPFALGTVLAIPFQSAVFFYCAEAIMVIHSSVDAAFVLEEHSQSNHFAYTVYWEDISILNILLFQRNTCSHTF